MSIKLCLDIGNTELHGGVFDSDVLLTTFRYDTKQLTTSDMLGTFLRMVLRENNVNPSCVTEFGFASVVPGVNYSVRAASIKYFDCEPFMLTAQSKLPVTIATINPNQLGADLIAGAVAAVQRYPNKDMVVVDFGTATTLSAIRADGAYLGTSIIPGLKTSAEALKLNAANLPEVAIVKPQSYLGRTTVESMQAGLYYNQLAAIREISQGIVSDCFGANKTSVMIGTGGFARLFAEEQLFDIVLPNLVIEGIKVAMDSNQS